MIIRSLSRKTASFRQLYDYINRDNRVPYFVSWNLNTANHLDRDKILEQFYQNEDLLPKRKNGNALYHEIVSIKYNASLSMDQQMKALHDLTLKFIQVRGPNLLAYGRMHMESGNLHCHVMFSANELNQSKRYWLTKGELAQIQKQCERYIRQTYPDLKQPVLYERESTQKLNKTRQQEYEYERRTGKKTMKRQVAETLTELFAQDRDQSLETLLLQHEFELYRRGKHVGVIHRGKKRYRLETLGLTEEFVAAKQRQQTPTPESQKSESPKKEQKEDPQPRPKPTSHSPKPDQKNTCTGNTMNDILKGLQDLELKRRVDLLEKVLRQTDLLKEEFPREDCTIRRDGNTVFVTVGEATVEVEFTVRDLDGFALGEDEEFVRSKREKAVKDKFHRMVSKMKWQTKEQGFGPAWTDRNSAPEEPELER